jgi:bromodomain-containing factor 1
MMDDKEDEAPAKLAKPPAKKKNKPMSKSEQERKIEQLEGTLETFQRHASGSQEPMPS